MLNIVAPDIGTCLKSLDNNETVILLIFISYRNIIENNPVLRLRRVPMVAEAMVSLR
jgi:energy-converting hydrogenase Eha subunit E